MRRPRGEVFAFHADVANLSRVVPFAHLFLRNMEIRVFEAPRCFVDTQRFGPFTQWRHSHHFTPVGDFTLVEDVVSFRLAWPFGLLGVLVERVVATFLRLKLRRTAVLIERE